MANILEIWKRCTNCSGTGKVIINDPPYGEGLEQEVDCTFCGGNGELLWGEMRKRELPAE